MKVKFILTRFAVMLGIFRNQKRPWLNMAFEYGFLKKKKKKKKRTLNVAIGLSLSVYTLGLFKCIVSDLFFYNNQKSATSVFVIPTSVLVISCKSVVINTEAIKEINRLRSKGMSRAAL